MHASTFQIFHFDTIKGFLVQFVHKMLAVLVVSLANLKKQHPLKQYRYFSNDPIRVLFTH